MAKKIKTFNVDEDTYKTLVKLFKKHEVAVSLSSYVDSCLNNLLTNLKEIEGELKKGTLDKTNYPVPMSFIINKIVSNKGLSEEYEDEEINDLRIFSEITEWQNDYEAQRRKIPVPFVLYLGTGLYDLSPDKKYLIEKKTGKRYISGKTRNSIFEVKE